MSHAHCPFLPRWRLRLQSSCSARADTANPSQQVWVEVVPDVWEKLPHFQDSNAKDLILDTRTMKFTFEMTDEDYTDPQSTRTWMRFGWMMRSQWCLNRK